MEESRVGVVLVGGLFSVRRDKASAQRRPVRALFGAVWWDPGTELVSFSLCRLLTKQKLNVLRNESFRVSAVQLDVPSELLCVDIAQPLND